MNPHSKTAYVWYSLSIRIDTCQHRMAVLCCNLQSPPYYLHRQIVLAYLPPLYLLSACRFIKDNGVTQERIICLFKEWKKYEVNYNDTDVNKLTYEEFFNLISREKSKHCVPNIIFNYGKPCSHCPLSRNS